MVLDRTAEGGWLPGGPSLYAARCAAALGAEVTLVTGMEPGYPVDALAGLRLITRPVSALPRYANTYDATGARSQLLLEAGGPLPLDAFAGIAACDALFIAPAYHEIDRWPALPAVVRAASLQGLLRAVDARRRVVHRPGAWAAVQRLAAAGATCFLSDEDTDDAEGLARQVAAAGGVALVTHGRAGATRFEGASQSARAATPATPVDPTGAGDCFAMAYTLRLVETADADAAFAFALAAGALAVEGVGVAGIPTRAAVEARLAKAAA